jgi:hypothetical protein
VLAGTTLEKQSVRQDDDIHVHMPPILPSGGNKREQLFQSRDKKCFVKECRRRRSNQSPRRQQLGKMQLVAVVGRNTTHCGEIKHVFCLA